MQMQSSTPTVPIQLSQQCMDDVESIIKIDEVETDVERVLGLSHENIYIDNTRL